MEHGEPLSLLIADIDNFKRFNDTYGHQIGDQVLRLVAHTLTECVKGRDTPARYGGEEFAIVLPQTRIEAAKVRGRADPPGDDPPQASRLRQGTGEDLGSVTLSFGAALLPSGRAGRRASSTAPTPRSITPSAKAATASAAEARGRDRPAAA